MASQTDIEKHVYESLGSVMSALPDVQRHELIGLITHMLLGTLGNRRCDRRAFRRWLQDAGYDKIHVPTPPDVD